MTFDPNRPADHPTAAGVAPGYVRQSTLEERLTRLEGLNERLVALLEEDAAARFEYLTMMIAADRIRELERENRNLRAEAGELKR